MSTDKERVDARRADLVIKRQAYEKAIREVNERRRPQDYEAVLAAAIAYVGGCDGLIATLYGMSFPRVSVVK